MHNYMHFIEHLSSFFAHFLPVLQVMTHQSRTTALIWSFSKIRLIHIYMGYVSKENKNPFVYYML